MKTLCITICLLVGLAGCTPKEAGDRTTATGQTRSPVRVESPLAGTWIYHDSTGFTLIDIKDTAHVDFYSFTDRHKQTGRPHGADRYWYYESKATMGFFNDSTLWVATDRYRFDYRIRGDTLVEFDKMGEQGVFTKMVEEENEPGHEP